MYENYVRKLSKIILRFTCSEEIIWRDIRKLKNMIMNGRFKDYTISHSKNVEVIWTKIHPTTFIQRLIPSKRWHLGT